MGAMYDTAVYRNDTTLKPKSEGYSQQPMAIDIEGEANRKTDRETERQRDRQRERQTGRQTESRHAQLHSS